MSPEAKLGTALVVEDDSRLLQFVVSDLREAGYEVYSAKTAKEGVGLHLSRVAEGLSPFNLIVTDNNTEEKEDGTRLLKLHPSAECIPIIVMSGEKEGAIERVDTLKALGWLIDFLEKPFNLGDIPTKAAQLRKELEYRNDNPTSAA